VVKRFLAVFYPPAEYLLTTRITRVAGEPFKTEGKVLVSAGWLAVSGATGGDTVTRVSAGTRWRMKTFHRTASAINVMDAAIKAVSRRSTIRAICQNARPGR